MKHSRTIILANNFKILSHSRRKIQHDYRLATNPASSHQGFHQFCYELHELISVHKACLLEDILSYSRWKKTGISSVKHVRHFLFLNLDLSLDEAFI